MLLGPAESRESSLMVTPTEPSGPVFKTSEVSSRTPTLPGITRPSRSIDTWPFETFIWPISPAVAGAASPSTNAAISARTGEDDKGMERPADNPLKGADARKMQGPSKPTYCPSTADSAAKPSLHRRGTAFHDRN